MTISYVEPVKTYVSSGNGAYPFTFKILAESDIEVWYTSASTGARVQLVRGSDFSVTVSNPGGTVTILGNAPAGGQILIQRRVPVDQPTNWVNNGPFDMDLLEADLDRIIMIAQQLHWDVSSGQAAINYRGPWVTLAEYTERDIVRTVNGNYYFCVVSHTSGTFATDLAAGDWVLLIDFEAIETHATNAAASAADALASRNTAIARSAAAELSEIAAAASAAAAAADADEIRDWPVSTGLATDVAEHLAFSRKNLLINGGFDVWQDGTSFTATGTYYTADGWEFVNGPGGGGVEKATNGVIITYTSAGAQVFRQKVENVTKFSDTPVTFSFDAWDDLASGGVVLIIKATQNFGTGGAPAAPVVISAAESITVISSRMRYQVTIALPSTSGKTLGTNNDSFLMIEVTPSRPAFDKAVGLDRCQLEFGDTATDFEYRHPAEELMLCQRYYETGYLRGPFAQYLTDYAVGPYCQFFVEKRRVPSITLETLGTTGHDGTPGALFNANANARGFNPVYNWTAGTVGRSFFGYVTWTADARL